MDGYHMSELLRQPAAPNCLEPRAESINLRIYHVNFDRDRSIHELLRLMLASECAAIRALRRKPEPSRGTVARSPKLEKRTRGRGRRLHVVCFLDTHCPHPPADSHPMVPPTPANTGRSRCWRRSSLRAFGGSSRLRAGSSSLTRQQEGGWAPAEQRLNSLTMEDDPEILLDDDEDEIFHHIKDGDLEAVQQACWPTLSS